MTLRVVGAGLGRTGTHSLKIALEQLLGAPCYHMLEVIEHPEFIPQWQQAVDSAPVDWNAVMNGYAACVDWPAASFWRELVATYPDAIVLLSTRSSTQAWWKSANETIFAITRRGAPPDPTLQEQMKMITGLLEKHFTPDWSDETAAKRAYERHNEEVRAGVPGARLVEWQPGDGWEPICAALSLPVQDVPFPHANTTDEFRAMVGLA
jgi:Sulfotransferase domain